MSVGPQSSITYETSGSATPEALLLLLHGVGGNEAQLRSLALPQDPRILCVRPRAPLVFGPSSFGWFEVTFGPKGPAINFDQAEASRHQLILLLEKLQAETGLRRERTVIAGFSQGGIMSAGLGLTRPDLVAGFGLFSGRILPEIETMLARPQDLQHLAGFVSHGLQDTTLPVSWADRADTWLQELGVPFVSRRYSAGHEWTPDMARDFQAWLNNLLGI